MKKPLVIIGIVVVVLLVIVIALPLVINVNRFKPTLETKLSDALGRKVEIGNIGLSILSGSVDVDNLVVADDPAFSHSPFLQAKELKAGVALLPLIFSGKLEVSSFTITEPNVSILRSPSGKWNFSSLGAGGQAKTSSSSSSAPANFSVEELKLNNGTMVVGTAGAGGKTQTYQDMNLEASDLSYTSQFPFKFSAKTPGDGSIKVEGKAGPINATDSSLTPLSATIGAEHLDLASTGFVDASSGLAGLIDFTGDLASDGQQMTSKGTLKADKIKAVAGGSPSKVPVNVDYNTAYDLKKQSGVLTTGDVHIGSALAHLTGSYDTSGAAAKVDMKLTGQAMPVPDLEGILPAVGVTLPSGAALTSGGLNLNLTITGPVDRLVVAGPVDLSNGKLSGFNLKSKLGALSSFPGLGGGGGGGSDTEIQKLSATIHFDPSGTQADDLLVIVPSIGTVTGTAHVSASGQLNCKMSAKLAGGMGTVTSALTSFGGGKNSQGIPFTVTGTTSNPIFLPDMKGMAGNMAKGLGGDATGAAGGATGAAKALGGLFGKKKN
ncbi:MAG TPA: AsmA family protein [Candidatus Acidoferrales bacterium]|jgi:AsmA protein|nr:AsmA family protein [Candidatus Acidoferrales bacterium]